MLTSPINEVGETNTVEVSHATGCMTSIIHYLQSYELAQDELKAKKISKRAKEYTIMPERLYKMGKDSLMLMCLGEHEIAIAIAEVHQGACDNHIGDAP